MRQFHALPAGCELVQPASDGRRLAWLAYVPIPGLALVPVAVHPGDRLTRFHAWQGTIAVLGLVAWLLVIGLLARLSDADAYRTTLGIVSGLGLLAGLVQLGWGIASAALGRFQRLRPWWDLASLVRR